MRKNVKNRLEKALITLQEPGGSTIRSIMKVINHDSPVLSLKKVLEALQEGINEGFLCTYNGRFKLRKQLFQGKEADVFDSAEMVRRQRKKKQKTPDSNVTEEDSVIALDTDDDEEEEDEDDDDGGDDEEQKMDIKTVQASINQGSKKALQRHTRKNGNSFSGKKTKQKTMKRTRFASKQVTKKSPPKAKHRTTKIAKQAKEPSDNLLLSDSSSGIPEAKLSKPTSEKPDLKKQRGPRCTSMKKEVRMPSKVHIPFVRPSLPQKGNAFNDLVRRSPDPVNGPLFDDYSVGLGLAPVRQLQKTPFDGFNLASALLRKELAFE